MTEPEWLACTNPDVMLDHLEKQTSERKLRLYGCACCRRIAHLLPDERSRAALDVAERFADGAAGREELSTAHKQAVDAIWDVRGLERDCAQAAAWVAAPHSWDAADATGRVAAKVLSVAAGRPSLLDQERREQSRLLKDIVGNLFLPPLPRAALAGNILPLAKAMYGGADRRAELHAALTELGHSDLAEHFAAELFHPRGCWALDVILGKK